MRRSVPGHTFEAVHSRRAERCVPPIGMFLYQTAVVLYNSTLSSYPPSPPPPVSLFAPEGTRTRRRRFLHAWFIPQFYPWPCGSALCLWLSPTGRTSSCSCGCGEHRIRRGTAATSLSWRGGTLRSPCWPTACSPSITTRGGRSTTFAVSRCVVLSCTCESCTCDGRPCATKSVRVSCTLSGSQRAVRYHTSRLEAHISNRFC